MDLVPLSPDRATKLYDNLSKLSNRAGINGYLTGLIQDVQRCIKVNMASDPDNDNGDEAAIDEIIEHLKAAEMTLSQYMNTAIIRSE